MPKLMKKKTLSEMTLAGADDENECRARAALTPAFCAKQ